MSTPPPIVVCPLRFEERAMQRAGLDRRARLVCPGPGPEAITAWAERHDGASPLVILAGLAGDVSGRHAPGTAAIVTEVRGEDGAVWRPRGPAGAACVAGQAAAVVREEAVRAALAGRGVDVVDLESVAFAEAASSRGWRWGVVRGISDDARSPLPVGVEEWVDERGAARPGRTLWGVLARPASVPGLLRLRRDSTAALRAVATLIEEHLESWCAGSPDGS